MVNWLYGLCEKGECFVVQKTDGTYMAYTTDPRLDAGFTGEKVKDVGTMLLAFLTFSLAVCLVYLTFYRTKKSVHVGFTATLAIAMLVQIVWNIALYFSAATEVCRSSVSLAYRAMLNGAIVLALGGLALWAGCWFTCCMCCCLQMSLRR